MVKRNEEFSEDARENDYEYNNKRAKRKGRDSCLASQSVRGP